MTGQPRIQAVPGLPALAAAITCAVGCALLAAPAIACDEERKPAVSTADEGEKLVWVTKGDDENDFWFEMGDGENVWVTGDDDEDFRWIEMGDDDDHEGFTWRSKGDGEDMIFRVGKGDDGHGTTYESWRRRGDDDEDADDDDEGCCGPGIVIRLDGHGLGDLIERLLAGRGDRLPRNLDRMFGSLPKGMNRFFGKEGIRLGGPGRFRVEIDEDGAMRDLALPKIAERLGGGVGRYFEQGARPRVRLGGGEDGEMVIEVEADDMHFGGGNADFGGEVTIKIDDGSGEPRVITKRFGSGGHGEARGHDHDEDHEAHEEHEEHEAHDEHEAHGRHGNLFELKLMGEGDEGLLELIEEGHVIDLSGEGEGIMVIEVDDGSGEPRIIERRYGPGAGPGDEGPRRLRIRRGGEGEERDFFVEEGEQRDAPRPRVERERLPRRAAAPAPPARAARPARPERPERPRIERDLESRLERLADRLERLEVLLEKLMDRRENRRTGPGR